MSDDSHSFKVVYLTSPTIITDSYERKEHVDIQTLFFEYSDTINRSFELHMGSRKYPTKCKTIMTPSASKFKETFHSCKSAIVCVAFYITHDGDELSICAKDLMFYKKIDCRTLMMDDIEDTFVFDFEKNQKLCRTLALKICCRVVPNMKLHHIHNMTPEFFKEIFDHNIYSGNPAEINFNMFPENFYNEEMIVLYIRYSKYTYLSDIPAHFLTNPKIIETCVVKTSNPYFCKDFCPVTEDFILHMIDSAPHSVDGFFPKIKKCDITDNIIIKALECMTSNDYNVIKHLNYDDMSNQLKIYFVSTRKHDYSLGRIEFFDKLHIEIPCNELLPKDIVKRCCKRDNTSYKYLYTDMFDALSFLKKPFLSWIRDCSMRCSVSLTTIGKSSLHHKQSRQWKYEIAKKSMRRLNITDKLSIHNYYLPIVDCFNSVSDDSKSDYDFTNESRVKLIHDNDAVFKFLIDLGFEIHIYQQKQIRRGIRIVVANLYDEIENDNFETNIFIVNPNVSDGDDYVTSDDE